MKSSIIIFFMFLMACCTQNQVEPEGYWGDASLILNNVQREFKPFGIDDGEKIDLHMNGFSENEELRFQLTLGLLNRTEYVVDSFALFNSGLNKEYAVLLTFQDDGHVLGNLYKNINEPGDYLEITELDTISGEIRGTFQLSFVVDSNFVQNDPWGLDTILLKNGIFHTKLK